MPSVVKATRGGQDDQHRAAYVQQGVAGPARRNIGSSTPLCAGQNEHTWAQLMASSSTHIRKPRSTRPPSGSRRFSRNSDRVARDRFRSTHSLSPPPPPLPRRPGRQPGTRCGATARPHRPLPPHISVAFDRRDTHSRRDYNKVTTRGVKANRQWYRRSRWANLASWCRSVPSARSMSALPQSNHDPDIFQESERRHALRPLS